MQLPGHLRSIVASLLLAVAVASCAPTIRSFAGSTTQVDDRLYFGRKMPGDRNVSNGDWRDFLEQVVVPKYPAGLTCWKADGQWRDSTGTIIRETTFVLELIHPDSAGDDAAIAEIIETYKARFKQESVLRVKSVASVGF